MAATNLARLYHEQKKYLHAQAMYLKARRAAEAVTTADDVRRIALDWINSQIENCVKHKWPDPNPGYRPPKTEGSVFNVQVQLNGAAGETLTV